MEVNVTVNINAGNSGHHRHLRFWVMSQKHNPNTHSLKGFKVDFTLTADMQLQLGVGAADEFGNPTTAGTGTPVVSGFDTTLVAVTVNADNSIQVVPVGTKLGATQIIVTDPIGAVPLTGTINLTITAGAAAELIFTAITTSPNPNAPAPPVAPQHRP